MAHWYPPSKRKLTPILFKPDSQEGNGAGDMPKERVRTGMRACSKIHWKYRLEKQIVEQYPCWMMPARRIKLI